MMHSQPTSKTSTIGESLIVISVVAGYFYLVSEGAIIAPTHIVTWLLFLISVIAFYFGLLIARIAFFHATGGGGYPWWATKEWMDMEERRKTHEAHMQK